MAPSPTAALLATLVAASFTAGCVSQEPAAGSGETDGPARALLSPLTLSNDTYERTASWRIEATTAVPIPRLRPHVPDPLVIVENADPTLGPPTPLTPTTRELLQPRAQLYLELLVGSVNTSKGAAEGVSLRAYVAVVPPQHLAAPERAHYYLLGAWTNMGPEAQLAHQWLFNQTHRASSVSVERNGGDGAAWHVEAQLGSDQGSVATLAGLFQGQARDAQESRRFANPYWDTSFFLDENATAAESGMPGTLRIEPGEGGLLANLIGPYESVTAQATLFEGGGSLGRYGFFVNPDGPLAAQTDWS